jgi:tetratricopeptide (TPR) repeat protein
MNRRLGLILLLAASLWAMATLHAATGESAFEQANQLYERGQFKAAAAAYEKLVAGGKVSPSLYFNLGNAFFKAGEVGRAIAAYRVAQVLAPRDPDVLGNLKIARDSVSGPALGGNGWLQRLRELTLNEWSILAAGALWLWLALLTVSQCLPNRKRSLRGYTTTVGVATALLSLGLGATLYDRVSIVPAVVVAPNAAVRYGPLDQAQQAFALPDGTEVRVVDQTAGWLEVRDGDHRTGWVRRDQVQVLSQVRPVVLSGSKG